MTEQEYLQRIHELEKQVLRLQTEIKKNSETQYGLRWMDVPEAFEAEAENAIPTLEEVPEKAISNDDGKPTHILIEGDNFHALTCLNYTHKGQIDVIYIDPPYNTGDDFIYKDKRILDKYPDGSIVPADHPLRHSYWLSFMHKRLELAKNLLSKRGVIFISINKSEFAQLKLLCDEIFLERNFIGHLTWESTTQPTNAGLAKYGLQQKAESILMYAKSKDKISGFNLKYTEKQLTYPNMGKFGPCRLEIIEKSDAGSYNRESMKFPILGVYPRKGKRWQIGQETADELVNRGRIEIVDGVVKRAVYPEDEEDKISYEPFWSHLTSEEVGTAQKGKDDLNTIMGRPVGFDTVKPISLISKLLFHTTTSISTILDFFGGSGTTMHATMQLNEEDGGHRQCILVQQNENNICEAVTYERNKRVMQGYTNAKGEAVAGLGNSMKYYRTAFVGEHKITDITDADKVALTQKAGCLLALGENNLEEIITAKSYQIFQLRKGDKPTNDFGYTAVYFSGNLMHFADFRREIEQIQAANPLTRIAVYVFTWGDPSVFENEFDDLSGITIKPIPQPILEIYQNIHQL